MSLEIVRGNVRNPIAVEALIGNLKECNVSGTLYLGYPIIATAEDSHTIDAMLISVEYGLIAFHFPMTQDKNEVFDNQDSIYYVLESNLTKHESLRSRRKLSFQPSVVAFYSSSPGFNSEGEYLVSYSEVFEATLEQCSPIGDAKLYKNICAAIQRVTTIKPAKKRTNVQKDDSKGAILKKLELEVANLDQWQKGAAIEVPEGPQRVRGLAGSGKTIVLALKAAYLHSQHPEWDIVVTFNTRSLMQQFTDLIERFSIEHSGDKPNWEKLRIIPAWGNSSGGVYYEIASLYDITPVNFATAKQKYGYSGAFEGICNELLQYVKASPPTPVFDSILIDEAQDLPSSFFQIVYFCTKEPKRIVWAYDELQNLHNSSMPMLKELFGVSHNGQQNIEVKNFDDEARQDIVLPVCYRNSPWALTLAHALGMGVYRDGGLVQLFDELKLFEDIGYKVSSGSLSFESHVSLERKK